MKFPSLAQCFSNLAKRESHSGHLKPPDNQIRISLGLQQKSVLFKMLRCRESDQRGSSPPVSWLGSVLRMATHIWMGSAGGAEGGKSQNSDYCHHPRPSSEMKSKQNSLYSCILPLSSRKIPSHVDRPGNIVSLLFRLTPLPLVQPTSSYSHSLRLLYNVSIQ